MRLGYGALVLSLTGLCGAVVLPKQESDTAEKTFKNIVSFKGAKASDIIPAMQFMGASLKVGCDFCHTEDRASDAKGAKATTRAMIAMQRDINEKHFHGRNQVTCATCHGGHTHPIALPPVEGVEIRPRRNETINPEEVLTAYGKAVNADQAKMIDGLMLKGTSTVDGQKAPVEAIYGSGKYAIDIKSPKADQRQGFNGTMAWFTTPNGIRSIPLQYSISYVNQKSLFFGPSTLPKLNSPTGATAQIAGKDKVVVVGTTEDNTRVSLYFDKKTGLLDRSVFVYPSILGNTAQTNDYADYKKVNGVLIPFTMINHVTEGDTILQYKSAKVAKIDPSAFEAPKK